MSNLTPEDNGSMRKRWPTLLGWNMIFGGIVAIASVALVVVIFVNDLDNDEKRKAEFYSRYAPFVEITDLGIAHTDSKSFRLYVTLTNTGESQARKVCLVFFAIPPLWDLESCNRNQGSYIVPKGHSTTIPLTAPILSGITDVIGFLPEEIRLYRAGNPAVSDDDRRDFCLSGLFVLSVVSRDIYDGRHNTMYTALFVRKKEDGQHCENDKISID